MSLVYDASSNGSFTGNASKTITHTTAADADVIFGILIMSASGASAPTSFAMTYAGAAMTLVSSRSDLSGDDVYLAVFVKVAPATGANNLAASWTNNGYGILVGLSFKNGDPNSPFTTTFYANDTTADQHLTVTGGDYVFDALGVPHPFSTTATVGAGQSEIVNTTVTSGGGPTAGDILRAAVSIEPSPAASVDMSWTLGASVVCPHLGVPVNALLRGGAPAASPFYMV